MSRQINPQPIATAPKAVDYKDSDKKEEVQPPKQISLDAMGIVKKYGVPAGAGVAGWIVGGMLGKAVGTGASLFKIVGAVVAAYLANKFNPIK